MASFEELLQCSVCLERFTSPKALPCLHTFCLSCLKGIIKDAKTLDCPTCRKTHPVPDHGATGYLDNLVIVNLLDVVGESTSCSDCGRKQALSECEHCQREVCPDCRVAHNLLKAEIATLIDLIDKIIPENNDKVKNSAQSSLAKILEAVTNVHETYEKASQTLTKKRDEFLCQLEALAKFQKAIVEDDKGSVIEGVRKELANCQSMQMLNDLKNSLSRVEEMMSGELLDLSEFGNFSEVSFGRGILASGLVGVGSAGMSRTYGAVADGGLAAAALPIAPVIGSRVLTSEKGSPSNVDYKAKQPLWKLVISAPAEGCDEFKPTCAIYSPLENAMYCLSNGKVLRYVANSGVGKIACGIFKVKHMALTDSGSLMLIDGKHIVKISADRLENPKEEAFTFVLANLPAGTEATQVCCHGAEVIVLDSGKRRFLRFDKGGELINEIKLEAAFHLNEFSKMCVDHEGRIYISNLHFDRKDNTVVHSQCYKEPVSVNLSFKWVISTVNSNGTIELAVDGVSRPVSKRFQYQTFQQVCGLGCGGTHTRIDKNSMTYDKIKSNTSVSSVKMMCVDSDGYISVTRDGENQIYVYDPKGQHFCTIGDPENSEFKEPTGLSLMSDGRLVVCDTGNKRILIF